MILIIIITIMNIIINIMINLIITVVKIRIDARALGRLPEGVTRALHLGKQSP